MSSNADPEKRRESDRRYRERNADKIRQRRAAPEAREAQRASEKRWRERNPDRKREISRQASRRYRERHPEAVAERKRLYEKRNRATRLEQRRQWREQNPQVLWAQRLRSHHGMYPEEWQAMWDAQDGCCYLCGEPLPEHGKTAVDHDHACCPSRRSCSRCRRGIAHDGCNQLIGLADDDPEKLHRIADNLAKAKEQLGDPPLTLFDLEDDP